uniref:Uncharacterized protein n=1 Tax=Anopheles culicifacies TaxID=139723 RepID=A0A182LSS2_9DIPT
MSPDGDAPGRVVVVVVAMVIAAWCSTPCAPPCTINGLSGVSVGVGVVLVVLPEVMMAWCEFGVLGRVSANNEATLKLLIRVLLFCCMGTVGLVMAIRTGVTNMVVCLAKGNLCFWDNQPILHQLRVLYTVGIGGSSICNNRTDP